MSKEEAWRETWLIDAKSKQDKCKERKRRPKPVTYIKEPWQILHFSYSAG